MNGIPHRIGACRCLLGLVNTTLGEWKKPSNPKGDLIIGQPILGSVPINTQESVTGYDAPNQEMDVWSISHWASYPTELPYDSGLLIVKTAGDPKLVNGSPVNDKRISIRLRPFATALDYQTLTDFGWKFANKTYKGNDSAKINNNASTEGSGLPNYLSISCDREVLYQNWQDCATAYKKKVKPLVERTVDWYDAKDLAKEAGKLESYVILNDGTLEKYPYKALSYKTPVQGREIAITGYYPHLANQSSYNWGVEETFDLRHYAPIDYDSKFISSGYFGSKINTFNVGFTYSAWLSVWGSVMDNQTAYLKKLDSPPEEGYPQTDWDKELKYFKLLAKTYFDSYSWKVARPRTTGGGATSASAIPAFHNKAIVPYKVYNDGTAMPSEMKVLRDKRTKYPFSFTSGSAENNGCVILDTNPKGIMVVGYLYYLGWGGLDLTGSENLIPFWTPPCVGYQGYPTGYGIVFSEGEGWDDYKYSNYKCRAWWALEVEADLCCWNEGTVITVRVYFGNWIFSAEPKSSTYPLGYTSGWIYDYKEGGGGNWGTEKGSGDPMVAGFMFPTSITPTGVKMEYLARNGFNGCHAFYLMGSPTLNTAYRDFNITIDANTAKGMDTDGTFKKAIAHKFAIDQVGTERSIGFITDFIITDIVEPT